MSCERNRGTNLMKEKLSLDDLLWEQTWQEILRLIKIFNRHKANMIS